MEIENYFVHLVGNRPPIFYINIFAILIGLSSLFYGIVKTLNVLMMSFTDITTILTTGLIFCHLEKKIKKESGLSVILTVISLFTLHLVRIYAMQLTNNMKVIVVFLNTIGLSFILKFREQLINKLFSYEYVFDIVTKILLLCSILILTIPNYFHQNDKE